MKKFQIVVRGMFKTGAAKLRSKVFLIHLPSFSAPSLGNTEQVFL